MKLNAEQVEELFRFTYKKRVRWYDLQVELVDHLASRIEETMQADKKLSFDRALQRVYDEFGIFGFSKVVQHAEESLGKKHRKIWWRCLIQQFTWPNVARSLFLFLVVYLISIFSYVALTAAILVILQWVRDFKHNRLMKKRYNTAKDLLLLERVKYLHSGSWIGFNFLVFDLSKYSDQAPGTVHFYFWLCICFFLVLNFLVTTHLRKEILSEAASLYPEVFKPVQA